MRPRRTSPALCASLLLLAVLGCAQEELPDRGPGGPAVVTPRASVVLEPPRLALGDTAAVEVVAITPPGWSVAPFEAPASPPGLWILETGRPEVEQQPERWVHRTRLRIRARRTGDFAWPALELRATAPDGAATTLRTEPRPLAVVPISPELAPRRVPFGYRSPEPQDDGGSPWLPAGLGALAALAAVALVALVRRARRAEGAAAGPEEEPAAPWRAVQATLSAAEEFAASDPVRAADMASAAVRLYVARRYRADTLTHTTEELGLGEAPFGLASRWERLLGLLQELDAVRFLPANDAGRGREAVLACIARGRELVIEMAPQGNWR